MRRNLKNLFVLGTLLCGATMYAQENIVTGTVKGPDGFPLEDAVVSTSGWNEVYACGTFFTQFVSASAFPLSDNDV